MAPEIERLLNLQALIVNCRKSCRIWLQVRV